jgi:hypothetical protein
MVSVDRPSRDTIPVNEIFDIIPFFIEISLGLQYQKPALAILSQKGATYLNLGHRILILFRIELIS